MELVVPLQKLMLAIVAATCILAPEHSAARVVGRIDKPAEGGGPPLPHPHSATTVPWTIEEVANAGGQCIALLAPIIADVTPAPPLKEGDCGTASPVLVKSLGRTNTVELRPPITVNCSTVVAL